MSAGEEKAALRRAMRQRAAALDPAYNARASAEICQALAELSACRKADTVFCFVGTAIEIDTGPFLRQMLAARKRLCVPLCTGKGQMEARAIRSLDELRPGHMGILEPPSDAFCVSPETIDFCVVPCLCATPDGARLGYGGGYYDRFLPRLRPDAARVLVCRKEMLVPQLPLESHDVKFDWVLTEK